ncbi:cytochrome bc1/b6f complex, Rieske iron sulfur subunit [Candidatus Sulfopaludibacter sp. SbA4]|nr:cytochrome bc1/b6f complex, Rieske iron sulfur subunit [Candidatus Sulfopaludibacter sp. SbA4]
MANPTLEPAGTAAQKPKSKPSLAQAFKIIFSKSEETDEGKVIARRRRFVMAAVLGTLGVNLLMFLRFFFPRALYEPKTKFTIGYPSDFGFGVDTKFQNAHRIWVVRNTEGIFVIIAICTHLGCTPDWKASENKFKCPCHGSGYDPEGINFEGPAPRPMDRAHVALAPDGQIEVDMSKPYSWPKGEPSQFGQDGAILRV